MKFPRRSGIVMHPSSFPGPYGIGDLGDAAFAFVDWLADAGQSYWQVLPLSPTGYGDSPYQGLSAFAGNPMLISPDKLVQVGHLDARDLEKLAAQGRLPARRVAGDWRFNRSEVNDWLEQEFPGYSDAELHGVEAGIQGQSTRSYKLEHLVSNLMCPATTEADVDLHLALFDEAVASIS